MKKRGAGEHNDVSFNTDANGQRVFYAIVDSAFDPQKRGAGVPVKVFMESLPLCDPAQCELKFDCGTFNVNPTAKGLEFSAVKEGALDKLRAKDTLVVVLEERAGKMVVKCWVHAWRWFAAKTDQLGRLASDAVKQDPEVLGGETQIAVTA